MSNNRSDTGFLYFLVGILFVAALGVGYAFYTGGDQTGTALGNTLIIEKTVTQRVPVPGADQSTPANQTAPTVGPTAPSAEQTAPSTGTGAQ